jgi:hypothetical protein
MIQKAIKVGRHQRLNGYGFTTELQNRVGEPVFTTKPVGDGLGLGLFLVTVFARRIGGTFRLRSVEGQGAVAMLYVPSLGTATLSRPELVEVKLGFNVDGSVAVPKRNKLLRSKHRRHKVPI